MGRKSDWSWAGHSPKFCTTITLACLGVGVPVPLLGALPGCRRWSVWTPYSQLLGYFTRVTLADSGEFLLHWVSVPPLKCPPYSSHLSVLSLRLLSPTPDHSGVSPSPAAPTKNLFFFPGETLAPPLIPSCYTACLGSVNCSTIVLYLTVNVHL